MLWWIMAAGALGTGARYLVGVWILERFGAGFPYATMAVNLIGCFLLGIVTHLSAVPVGTPELRAAVAIGLLGGFTTYSSFNQETLAMLSHGAAGAAALNVAVTLAGGLVAGWLGLVFARQLVA
ncbi:MAG: fluoride efflux transporter CrcB [Acidobacteriota bacterium]|nr:fluoride efflux transporter CrcB [Acidobacteriota bacterium]